MLIIYKQTVTINIISDSVRLNVWCANTEPLDNASERLAYAFAITFWRRRSRAFLKLPYAHNVNRVLISGRAKCSFSLGCFFHARNDQWLECNFKRKKGNVREMSPVIFEMLIQTKSILPNGAESCLLSGFSMARALQFRPPQWGHFIVFHVVKL